MRSTTGKILVLGGVAALALTLFLLLPKPISAATGGGIPCPGGGPDYRSQMAGEFGPSISRADQNGGLRNYAGFDSIYWAECINPAGGSSALNQLLNDINQDTKDGTITNCNGTLSSIDQYGNLQFCSGNSDSYVGIFNNTWCWSYYNGGYRCDGDNTPVIGASNNGDSTGGSTDTGSTDVAPNVSVPPNVGNGVEAMKGTSASIAFDSSKSQWLVVGSDGSQVTGQIFDSNNKPIGSSIAIGSGDTPKVAFSSDSNQFLVIWATDSTISGRLINEDGSVAGVAFRIGSGSGIKLFSNTALKYDSRNQRFVAVWNQGDNAMLNTIENGKAGGAINAGKAQANVSSGPTVAVDTKDNQYCITALNGQNITATAVDATALSASSPAQIADEAQENIGIEYDLGAGDYLASWIDTGGNAMGEILNQCSAPPQSTQAITISDNTQSGIMTYAENGEVFGVLLQENSSNIVNDLVTLDSQGISVGDGAQQLFGGGSLGNFPQGLTANGNHSFGAVAIQDSGSVQFAGNVGGGSSLVDTSAFKPQPTSKVPTAGLPTDLGSLIEAIFAWSLDIVGLVLFVRFFWAGLLWFTAAGNTSRTTQAKNIMQSAALGAILLFSSYVILYTINPDLVRSSFTLGGLPISQSSQNSNTPVTATSCFSALGNSKLTAQLQNYETTVLAKHPDLAQKQTSDSGAVQEFVTDIIQQSGGNAKNVSACDNSGNISDMIMLRSPGSTSAEICQVVSEGPGTINDLKTAACQYQADWSGSTIQNNTSTSLAPPSDALQKHPSKASVISATKQKLKSAGTDLSGACGAFSLVKASAKAIGEGAGLLKKPSGNNCHGYATDIIAYPDGYIYDALGDAGGANNPQWNPDVCGTDGTCSDRYAPAS